MTHIGEMQNAHKILIRKYQGRRPLRRPRIRWDDDIKMDLGDIGCQDVGWT
jgi:hypothetical protein